MGFQSYHVRSPLPLTLVFWIVVVCFFVVSYILNLSSPEKRLNLVGKYTPNLDVLSYEEMEFKFTWLQMGGQYNPSVPDSQEHVAILVPFRDREEHLRVLLNNLHPLLYRQKLKYTMYILEQDDDKPFNKGKLYNIGYIQAKKENHTCFVFHDVDLIPENDLILYGCVRSPMHLSRAINKFNYSLPDEKLIGGVSAWKSREFEQVNGWSNLFVNWGGEDDDMSYRVIANGLPIFRFSNSTARYTMLKHRRTPVNTARHRMLDEGRNLYKFDGLSSLLYTPPKIERHQLFTRILVSL